MKKMFKAAAILAAAATLATAFAGCGKNDKAGGETITWYVPTLISGDDKEEVMTKVNEILKSKYDLTLDMIGVDGGNYAQKLQVMNAGQEVYDLAFTSHWQNNYFSNVANGVFHDFTEEDLKKYAPKTFESMSSDVWDAVKVDGKIYAVPNYQIQARATAVFVPEKFLEETGTDIDNIKSTDDMMEYLRKIHKINPDCNKMRAYWAQIMPYYGMTEVYEENMPGAVKYTESGKPTVINQFESDEFKEYIALKRSWVSEGLAIGDYLPESKADTKEVMQQPLDVHIYKPGGAEETSASRGYNVKSRQFSPALLTTSGITAAMTGVSATSEHPEAALRMIEIINTDKEINNLLVYGIEGKDYEKIGENKVKLPEDKKYRGPRNWHIGSVENSYLLENQADSTYDDTRKFNDSAVVSPILGFNANLDNITLQTANCKTVINEYLELIDLGISSEEKYNEFISKLKAAGVDDIIKEMQKQIDEWWESK